MRNSQPRIVYNEECIDLRKGDSNMESRHKERQVQKPPWKGPSNRHQDPKPPINRNEVVNTALKKLARTYHTSNNQQESKVKTRIREFSFNEPVIGSSGTNRQKFLGADSLKSRSELTTSLRRTNNGKSNVGYPSSPVIYSNSDDAQGNGDPNQNKFTMTKEQEQDDKLRMGCKRFLRKDKSLEDLIDKIITEKPSVLATESSRNTLWKDHRLVEKYSLLKIPWKRSYTMPVYTAQASLLSREEFQRKLNSCSDKKTYLYDDGSDVDSMFYKESSIMQSPFFAHTFQTHLLTLLNISAYFCALCILSLIIWLILGNKYLYHLIIPKPPENSVKKYAKFIGGGVIYTVSSILSFIGRLFAIPTQQVYQPAPDYAWPP